MDDGTQVPGFALYLDAQDARHRELRVDGLTTGRPSPVFDLTRGLDPLVILVPIIAVIVAIGAYVLLS